MSQNKGTTAVIHSTATLCSGCLISPFSHFDHIWNVFSAFMNRHYFNSSKLYAAYMCTQTPRERHWNTTLTYTKACYLIPLYAGLQFLCSWCRVIPFFVSPSHYVFFPGISQSFCLSNNLSKMTETLIFKHCVLLTLYIRFGWFVCFYHKTTAHYNTPITILQRNYHANVGDTVGGFSRKHLHTMICKFQSTTLTVIFQKSLLSVLRK